MILELNILLHKKNNLWVVEAKVFHCNEIKLIKNKYYEKSLMVFKFITQVTSNCSNCFIFNIDSYKRRINVGGGRRMFKFG
jgi:hypothetical protein